MLPTKNMISNLFAFANFILGEKKNRLRKTDKKNVKLGFKNTVKEFAHCEV